MLCGAYMLMREDIWWDLLTLAAHNTNLGGSKGVKSNMWDLHRFLTREGAMTENLRLDWNIKFTSTGWTDL